MTLVQPGDLIFCNFNGRLVAVCLAAGHAYTAPDPSPTEVHQWATEGWRLDGMYLPLPTAIPFNQAQEAIGALVDHQRGPFDVGGGAKQGYLFQLSEDAGQALEVLIEANTPGNILDALQPVNADAGGNGIGVPLVTSARALITKRIGQTLFRKKLDDFWDGRCAVTLVESRSLLRASHIKPWSESNNLERLDPSNGLLLSAAYDAAFDSHLISFKEDGCLLLSPTLNQEEAVRAGLDTLAALRFVTPAMHPYLAYHRTRLKT